MLQSGKVAVELFYANLLVKANELETYDIITIVDKMNFTGYPASKVA
jgi:hypothetical protein